MKSSYLRTIISRKNRLALPLALLLTPLGVQAAPLLVQDFTNGAAWPVYGYKYGAGAGAMANPSVGVGAYGTIDSYNSTTPSTGLRLAVNSSAAGSGYWEAGATSGIVNVSANLAGVTDFTPSTISVSFDLWTSYSRPVKVALESYSANDLTKRTGRSEAYFFPAAAKFYQRKVLELDQFTTSGSVPFQPNSPYYRVLFIVESDALRSWPKASDLEVRVDNVNISTPAYYVDADTGSDYTVDGKTKATAFLSIGKAIGKAQPGDIILVHGGTKHYRNYDFYTGSDINYYSSSAAVNLNVRGGAPGKWIVLKNYPGERPVIESSGYQCVLIGGTTNAGLDVSYTEVRGFEIVGVAKQLDVFDPGENYHVDNKGTTTTDDDEVINDNKIKGKTGIGGTDTTGVYVRGDNMGIHPHHIRVADNIVHDLAGGGVIGNSADWLTFENNAIFNTSLYTPSATSGISILSPYDFPGTSGEYRMLVSGNEVHDNECRKQWVRSATNTKFSDGNGIILDSFRNHSYVSYISYPAYRGRTLAQNNISYHNGGSGIHSYYSDHADIIHNSAHSNSQRSAYQGSYGEIFAQSSNDIRIYNNILVADPGQNLNACSYSTDQPPENQNSPRWDKTTAGAGVMFRNNLYKYSDTDVNGTDAGGVTLAYPVVNNTPVVIRASPPAADWQRNADLAREQARKNQNEDAALAENNTRTYATIWNNANAADYTLGSTSPARQFGTLVVSNSDATELPFEPSIDIDGNDRIQGTLASPNTKLPDAGALESPASQ